MSKRKTKKKSSGRRRRMSGISGGSLTGMLTMVAAVAAGAVAAEMVASKVAPDMDEKYKGLILAGVGVALPKFVLKSELGKSIGAGMVAVGAVKALRSFGVISGIGAEYLELPMSVNGTGDDNLNVIAGLNDNLSVIAGLEE